MIPKKLAVFGDSFGVVDPAEEFASWVTQLSHHFKVINHCECGVGEYKILQQLKSVDLTQFDNIIVSHTSATRVYVKGHPLHKNSNIYKNCDIIYADIAERTDDFSIACQNYFKYIFDLNYAIDIHNLICKEIDTLLQNLPVTHITNFNYAGLYDFPDMINFYTLFLQNRGNVNHYNQYGNDVIYKKLLKKLCLK